MIVRINVMFGAALCLLFAAVALADPVPTTIDDFFLPGSQPLESGTFTAPTQCDNCHGGYEPQYEPDFNWSGSMMGQAARDPLFYACMTIANQDAPDAGDLCIRCHSPTGWLEGRSEPTDGSALTAADRNSIHCDFCHRTLAPSDIGENPYPDDSTYTADSYPLDQQYLQTIASIPPTDGNGMFVTDTNPDRRGPYIDTAARHNTIYSPYHSDARICGTCHDVSSPVFTRVSGRDYEPNTFGAASDTFDTYAMFPLERTYSEWLNSDFNSETGVYAPEFGGNLSYVSTCQDCHMRNVTGYGCSQNDAPLRDDLPLHDMMGGNTFGPLIVAEAYPSEVNTVELDSAAVRATYMLQNAASMELNSTETDTGWIADVTVTNKTGHKLPSGYPEGRRIWLRITATDALGDTVYQSGAYDSSTADLTIDDDIKLYEIQPGISHSLSPTVNLPAGKSFHFVLNDTVYKDNRIPPRGFTNVAFETIGSPVAGYSYGDGQYWDVSSYSLPSSAAHVTADLLYQSASKEYITFLRDENVTDARGDSLYAYWERTGKSEPVVMQSVTDMLNATGTPDPTYTMQDSTWHLAGIPVDLVDPADGLPTVLFGDDFLGLPYGSPNWQVSRYNMDTHSYDRFVTTGQQNGLPALMAPGYGYWMIYHSDDPTVTLDIAGDQHTGSPSPPVTLVDALPAHNGDRNGLQMFANPFNSSYAVSNMTFTASGSGWSDVVDGGSNDHDLNANVYAWDGSDYVIDSYDAVVLDAWEGFWLMRTAGTNSDPIDVTFSAATPEPMASVNFDWRQSIVVQSDDGQYSDASNRIGMSEDLLDGYDSHDAFELGRPLSSSVTLAFVHPDDPDMPALAFDYRDAEWTDSEVWDIEIKTTNLPERGFTLTWPEIDQLDPALRLTLHERIGDNQYIEVGDLRQLPEWSFSSGAGSSTILELRLVLQPSGTSAGEKGGVLPEDFAVLPAHPNPFNPTTTFQVKLPVASDLTVTVHNVIGRRVATLVRGRHRSGTHTLVFDGRNMASGLYFIRTTVPGELNQVQKVLLVK